MPPTSAWLLFDLPKTGKCSKAVVARLGRQESRRQRTAYGVRRTVVGAAPAIGAGVEVQHVLPGEVFEFLHAEGFHLIELARRSTPQRTGFTVPRSSLEKKTLNSEVSTWN